jgi:hypothetical protein
MKFEALASDTLVQNIMLFYKNFLLSSHPLPAIDGWRQMDVFGCFLSASATVPVIRVMKDGEVVAYLLGWVADRTSLLREDRTWDLAVATIEEFREGLCGRFVMITPQAGAYVTVSGDAGGLFPIVFDAEGGMIASSPVVIGAYKALEFDSRVAQGVRRADSTVWYPFGLTPYMGVQRLLPSESLSFGRGTCVISSATGWLPAATKPVTAEALCTQVAEYITSFATDGSLFAHLTAGYDSRMVMAAVLRSEIDIRFMTIGAKNEGARIDLYVAKRLTRLYGLGHITIPFEAASPAELSGWRERVGYCIDDAVAGLCRTVKNTDSGNFTLTGACGEVGRAFYWEDGDIGATGLSPSSLLRRLGFTETTLLESEADKWLRRFPKETKRTLILDNAYIDLRLGCWGGPSMPGHLIPRPTISPFNSVSVFRAMLALDEVYRYSQQFAIDFIKSGSPRLLSEGFNRVNGLARFRYLKSEIKSLLPIRFLKKIRQYVKG